MTILGALCLPVTSALAGVVRLPLASTQFTTGPFQSCKSSGRLRAFYGAFGMEISLRLTGLVDVPDGDGRPCSGDEYICLVKTNSGTIILRPEPHGGTATSVHNFCGEGAFCPIPGTIIGVGAISVACYDRGDADYFPSIQLEFSTGCEGDAFFDPAPPDTPLIAVDGAEIGCP